LERGNKLENMSLLSSNLSQESKKYLRDTRNLNLMLLWRHYGPMIVIAVALILFIYVYWRFL
jgi:vesicle transport protein SEC22